MKLISKTLLGALFTGLTSLVPLAAEEANGFITVSFPNSNTLLIVDTNSQKILMYDVSENKGLSLKEVRAFDKALEAPSFFYSKGMSGTDEKTKLEKILKAVKR
jgi:hypothetical protein